MTVAGPPPERPPAPPVSLSSFSMPVPDYMQPDVDDDLETLDELDEKGEQPPQDAQVPAALLNLIKTITEGAK